MHLWGRDSNRPFDGGVRDQSVSLLIPVVALSVVTVVALQHPHPAVMMLLSVVLVVAGFVFAAIQAVRCRASGSNLVDRLVLPAIIVFFGFAAAMLGDPDPAVESLMRKR
jgi:hypothetical protein